MNKSCGVCKKNNHTTNSHVCSVCKETGHGPKKHKSSNKYSRYQTKKYQTKKYQTKNTDRKERRVTCNICKTVHLNYNCYFCKDKPLDEQTHKCTYHRCTTCKDFGHELKWGDHPGSSTKDIKLVCLYFHVSKPEHDGYCSDPGKCTYERNMVKAYVVHPNVPVLPDDFFKDLYHNTKPCTSGSGYCGYRRCIKLFSHTIKNFSNCKFITSKETTKLVEEKIIAANNPNAVNKSFDEYSYVSITMDRFDYWEVDRVSREITNLNRKEIKRSRCECRDSGFNPEESESDPNDYSDCNYENN